MYTHVYIGTGLTKPVPRTPESMNHRPSKGEPQKVVQTILLFAFVLPMQSVTNLSSPFRNLSGNIFGHFGNHFWTGLSRPAPRTPEAMKYRGHAERPHPKQSY